MRSPTIQDFRPGTRYQMKSTFGDGTVKTRKQFDKDKWVDCIFTESERPYIERMLSGRNAENGLLGLRIEE